MARYIDADKFITWIDTGHLRPADEVCLSENNVVEMINLQPTADVAEVKWIDVNDRLPNKSGLVLCYLKENSFGANLRMRLAYFNHKDERFYEATRYVDDNWCSNLYPIYWMPRPEPPSGAKMDGGKAE